MILNLVVGVLIGTGLAWLILALLYALIRTISWALTAAPAWWARNIIADDPHPELSNLDRRDGL